MQNEVTTELERFFGMASAMSGFLGVAFGAFGAHALRDRVSSEMLAVYNTGVQYHLFHSLALMGVAWLASRSSDDSGVAAAGFLFIVGMVLFSGSLYAMALTGHTKLGAITPLGGLAFLGGWLSLAYAFYKLR